MGEIKFPNDHTAEQWRAMANDCDRRERESFERSDTDGFLSQWAMAMTSRLYRQCAEVAEQGGEWDFTVLADADGNEIADAREIKTKYGYSWLIPGRGWFNPSKARDEARAAAANLAKGYQFITVRKPAVVTLTEGGVWGCYPVVLPRTTPVRPRCGFKNANGQCTRESAANSPTGSCATHEL